MPMAKKAQKLPKNPYFGVLISSDGVVILSYHPFTGMKFKQGQVTTYNS
jgi:hypothetical protein